MPIYSPFELWMIALSVFLLAMGKGGFPIGPVALPVLILTWPTEAQAARSAVAFILPVLCAMDIVAVAVYRRHIDWRRLLPLAPGTLLGVGIASVLFVSNEQAIIAVSDRALKVCIGIVGLLFVLYQTARRSLTRSLEKAPPPGRLGTAAFGTFAGLTSTLAHAAGPLMQMYFLSQRLPKLSFAGTMAGFFFALNLVKLAPFGFMGRITPSNLVLALWMLPVVPLGVLAGHVLVRLMRPAHYRGFIYVILAVTSVALIVKAGH
jgi:uncharacterized membrane protein YfcA